MIIAGGGVEVPELLIEGSLVEETNRRTAISPA